ncbi:tRNA methyltransferase ppm2 [Entomortierella beljakovae]|nr:tRNA methyltransferase ppm2 [Entomortierella beljakovae]
MEEDEATDLAVQGTNTSSITSKRSLERLGYLDVVHIQDVTDEDSPMMFKYVVPKSTRRSPVINRAYFQRVMSIHGLINAWINECELLGISECAIISLGCGLLVTERLYMIRNQKHLFNLLPENPTKDDVGEFVSDTYSCIGVDLRKLDQLEKGLESAGVLRNQSRMPILVISEVVLAYLEASESDSVLRFFSQYPEATFVLHEQCIPTFDSDQDQENMHPFASTMFRHFERTMTPLKTLRNYQSLEDHRDRLQKLGWTSCDILNLNLYSDMVIFPQVEDHQRLLEIEPFDEYDELYWIGSFYFNAIATTGPGDFEYPTRSPDVFRSLGLTSKLQQEKFRIDNHVDQSCYVSLDSHRSSASPRVPTVNVEWSEKSPFPGMDINRKGHSLSILGDSAFIFGGFGLDAEDHREEQKVFQARSQQTRLGSMIHLDLVSGSLETLPIDENGPAPRMHHSTVSTLDGSAIYMYGGRDGPSKVHNDVWRFTPEKGWDPLWRARMSQEGSDAFPPGLFKHTANMMTIAGREMMVVIGGRTQSGEANDKVWAFDLEEGQWGIFNWRNHANESKIEGIFSHSSVVVKDRDQQDILVVIGGIRGNDEKVLDRVWHVTLGVNEDESQCWVDATEVRIQASTGTPLKPRFGHSSVVVGYDRIWVLGGVSAPSMLTWQETMMEIQLSTNTFRYLNPSSFKELVMVGHSAAVDKERNRVIGVGGGGTCFGFGAWWDASGWALSI